LPNYGYRCQSCQREFEVQQRMADPPQSPCPDCGGAGTRLFYPTGILFKGSGFYKTDSRSTAAAATSSSTGDKPAGDGATEPTKPKDPVKDSPASPAPAKTSESTKPAAPAPD
jgi:putative FmdB family regulatory protein